MAAAKLDEYWSRLRTNDPDLIGRSLLRQTEKPYSSNTQLDAFTAYGPFISLSEALGTYLTHWGADKSQDLSCRCSKSLQLSG